MAGPISQSVYKCKINSALVQKHSNTFGCEYSTLKIHKYQLAIVTEGLFRSNSNTTAQKYKII